MIYLITISQESIEYVNQVAGLVASCRTILVAKCTLSYNDKNVRHTFYSKVPRFPDMKNVLVRTLDGLPQVMCIHAPFRISVYYKRQISYAYWTHRFRKTKCPYLLN